MTDSPKVLSLVWNLIRGGTEGQCARLAMELARAGHSHRVGVFRHEGFFLDAVERACGPVFHVDIRRMVSVQTLRQVRDLARIVRRERIDVFHAWDSDAAIFGSMAAVAAGVPLITSRRDLGQIYPAHKLWLMRRADRQASAVVANADAIVEGLRREGLPSSKAVRVTNMIDVREFDATAAESCDAVAQIPAGLVVGMVSRLDPEKDVATFIRAAALVLARRSDVSFIVAGDGVERAGLEKLARDLRVTDRVIFLGDVKEVPALLRRFSLGVLVPRSNEGLSNTILEYMAAGLPVVATDCGGNRELVVDGQNGLVVRPGDPGAVAEAMIRLLDDPTRGAWGARGRERVLRENQPAVVAGRFAALYDRVAAEARHRHG